MVGGTIVKASKKRKNIYLRNSFSNPILDSTLKKSCGWKNSFLWVTILNTSTNKKPEKPIQYLPYGSKVPEPEPAPIVKYIQFLQKVFNQFIENLTTFFHLWSFHQWTSSLIGLVILYLITGHYYNKKLSNRNGWLSWKMRIWLIVFDFSLNLVLGMYYLQHRETVMGHIMLKCPIAVSPIIFSFLYVFCIFHVFGISILLNIFI